MFCGKCGKVNPDTGTFCSGCGSALHKSASVKAPVAAAVAPPPKPIDPREAFGRSFRDSWRELVRSPLVIIVLLLHTLLVILDIAQASQTLEMISDAIDGLSQIGIDLGDDIMDNLTWLLVLTMTPNVLIMVGMWMQLIESFRNSLHPISTTGISLIRGVTIFLIVVLVIFFCIGLLSTCGASAELENTDTSRYGMNSRNEELKNVLDGITIALIIMAIPVFIYYAKILRVLSGGRTAAETSFPDSDDIGGLAGWQFVIGVLGAISFFASMNEMELLDEPMLRNVQITSTEITFPTILRTVMPFLYGAALLKYKNMMETMEYTYHHTDFKRGGMVRSTAAEAYPGEKIPTWKRVEMIRKEEDARFSKSGLELAPMTSSAKTDCACPTCGKARNPEWPFCPNCGHKF